VADGEPRADGEETSEVAWFTVDELSEAGLTPFTLALFAAADVGGAASA
jgi:hypothetical protein